MAAQGTGAASRLIRVRGQPPVHRIVFLHPGVAAGLFTRGLAARVVQGDTHAQGELHAGLHPERRLARSAAA
jgi:hypothetical protein